MEASALLHASHALQGGLGAGLGVALFVVAMGAPAILILRPRGRGRRRAPEAGGQRVHRKGSQRRRSSPLPDER